MRQVFSSPRLENVEGIAQFLRDEGIEVRVTDGRSYRSAIRGNFSYRDNAEAGPRPAVWIVNSDDQPRARQLLRDAGLLHSASAPMPMDSYVPQTPHLPGSTPPPPVATRRMSRFRYGLLAGIALLVALTLFATRRPAPDAAPATTSPIARTAPTSTAAFPDTITAPSIAYVIATPPALAEMLFADELDGQDAAYACLAIDGGDPAADLLARLARSGGIEVRAASACAGDARAPLAIDVTRYRTDGSGVGTVAVVIHGSDDDRAAKNRIRELEVQRTDDRWDVLLELE